MKLDLAPQIYLAVKCLVKYIKNCKPVESNENKSYEFSQGKKNPKNDIHYKVEYFRPIKCITRLGPLS